MSNETWSPEDLRDLASGWPEYVRETPEGPVPLVTPGEMRALVQRYPSNFKLTPKVDRAQPDAEARARYPSMFEP